MNNQDLISELCLFVVESQGYRLLIEKMERQFVDEWKSAATVEAREAIHARMMSLGEFTSQLDTEALKARPRKHG